MSENDLTPQHLDVITVAAEHLHVLTEKDRKMISNIQYRLSRWGERGQFLVKLERRRLERIEIKLQTLVDAHRRKNTPRLSREEVHRRCQELLAELDLQDKAAA